MKYLWALLATLALGCSAYASGYQVDPGIFISHPHQEPEKFEALARHALSHGELIMFGSSELTSPSDYVIHRYLPRLCGKKVLSVGHAGFQSLSVLMTLAQLSSSIGPQSKVAIIVSPVWLNERGTSSAEFLRTLKKDTLLDLARMGLPVPTKDAIARTVRNRRDEFTGLSPQWLFWSLPALQRFLPPLKNATDAQPSVRFNSVIAPSASFEQDLKQARDYFEQQRKKNSIGVTDQYFDKIKNDNLPLNTRRLDPHSREIRDLYALSHFLSVKGVRAQFILQPIHRELYGMQSSTGRYRRKFRNLEERIQQDGHKWIDYFESFDPATLMDAAHFSDYGWLKVNKRMCDWLTSNSI